MEQGGDFYIRETQSTVLALPDKEVRGDLGPRRRF